MNNRQIRIIDSLREAAMEYGEVCDLLGVISESILIDDCGNHLVADSEQVEYLQAAIIAYAFAQHDRRDDKLEVKV